MDDAARKILGFKKSLRLHGHKSIRAWCVALGHSYDSAFIVLHRYFAQANEPNSPVYAIIYDDMVKWAKKRPPRPQKIPA